MSSGGGKGGGKGGGGSTSSPDLRNLAALANRFEQEGRGTREGALGYTQGILDNGADWLGPSMGGKYRPGEGGGTEPRRFTRGDLIDAYARTDGGKAQDIERIFGTLPESFTIDDLRNASGGRDGIGGGLSGRSKSAKLNVLADLEKLSRGRGSGLGGNTGGSGGYGAALLPIAQTAIERSKQATSQAVQGLTQQAASMKGGGADSPFFQRNIAQARILGDQQTSQIPSRITEQFLMNVLPLAFGQSATATQGLSSAAGIGGSLMQGNQAAGASSNAAMGNVLSSIASAIGSYYAMGALAGT